MYLFHSNYQGSFPGTGWGLGWHTNISSLYSKYIDWHCYMFCNLLNNLLIILWILSIFFLIELENQKSINTYWSISKFLTYFRNIHRGMLQDTESEPVKEYGDIERQHIQYKWWQRYTLCNQLSSLKSIFLFKLSYLCTHQFLPLLHGMLLPGMDSHTDDSRLPEHIYELLCLCNLLVIARFAFVACCPRVA